MVRALTGLDVDVRSLALDTALAAYLIDPAESRYLLEELVVRYAGAKIPEGDAAAEGQLDLEGSSTPGSTIAARRALAVDRLVAPLQAALDAQGLRALHDDIEVPLVGVLARMEDVGVGVDVDELRSLRDRLVADCDRLRGEIVAAAGHDFNVNSTPQLRQVLFDELGLIPQKKTKTGFSTDAASLEKLAGQHPIIEHLLAYREVEKLRSTYGDGLLAEVGPDHRIHATFNQTVARTGRLSSDQPNLHNIPVRSELGREFRRAFVPAPGHKLLVADYNQIELRCIAHLAEDPGLIESFESGRDIHTETAARIFHVEAGDVSVEMRSKAKMVSYGLAYGMEAYGLGQRLNIPTDEAAQILDAYFIAFPAVREYMEGTVAEARERGYTETLFGRRRPDPGAGRVELPDPPGGGAPGHERGHPGPGRRHLQGGARAPRRPAGRGRRPGQPADPPGARRGAPGGAAGPGRCRGRTCHRGALGGRRAAGAAGGQPVRRRQLGRGQGLRPVPEDHWFEPIAEHLGSAYLRYSFTKGTEQEVAFLVEVLGLEPGHAGARRRLRAGTPRPRPG